MIRKTLATTLTATALLALAGCNDGWKVNRVDPAKTTDLDYRFNDTDARQILQAMSQSALSSGNVERWVGEHGGRRPTIYLATVKNNTQDYINTELITNRLQDDLLNSGKFEIKAQRDLRQELRDERLDTKYNDPATVKRVAAEVNADLALLGSINDNKQRSTSGNTVVSVYEATLQLVDVETAKVIWRNTQDIKKVATR
jgi:uncharacterized protein (TIGR02722 family)